MALPRTIEDANKQMRTAAIERLRSEHGVVLDKKSRGPQGIARAIRLVEPSLQSDDAMLLIRAWVALKPNDATPSRALTETGRRYVLSAQMRQLAERAKYQPALMSISSNVSNFRHMEG